MPLPLILGIGAAIAGLTGVGTGIHGAVKMKEASDTMSSAKSRHKANIEKFEKKSKETTVSMDKIGKFELSILESFKDFSDTFEKIKNRPEINNDILQKCNLPKYNGQKLKEVSIGAGILLGGLGGAGLGAAGGFAAAGAATSAVMALGTASTGTAIASLSGAALTNATLAALGGGAIAAGGGGIALGTTILGASTLGVGLLVGGVIFSLTGGKLSDKADEAWRQMKEAEKKINEICQYLDQLKRYSEKYYKELTSVEQIYRKQFNVMDSIVNALQHTDWNTYTRNEKIAVDNTILLVGLLHEMCKVKLVLKGENEEDNKVNTIGVDEMIYKKNRTLENRLK